MTSRQLLRKAERHPDVSLRHTVDGHVLLLVDRRGVVGKLNPRKPEQNHRAVLNVRAQLRRAGVRL